MLAMERRSFAAALASAPSGDKTLLKALLASALATLAFGVVVGSIVALTRGGALAPAVENGYRLLTSHGVAAFFFWLYFAQAALLLGLAMTHGRDRPALALRPLAWLGGAAMLAGADSVKIHGQYVPVRAEVAVLHNLSAHADYQEILGWLDHFDTPPAQTFITHGEPVAADALRHRIEEQKGWRCRVPDYLEIANLD